jgi:hypothetical protein
LARQLKGRFVIARVHQQAPPSQRELDRQARVAIVQITAQNLLGAIEPVKQRIAVQV